MAKKCTRKTICAKLFFKRIVGALFPTGPDPVGVGVSRATTDGGGWCLTAGGFPAWTSSFVPPFSPCQRRSCRGANQGPPYQRGRQDAPFAPRPCCFWLVPLRGRTGGPAAGWLTQRTCLATRPQGLCLRTQKHTEGGDAEEGGKEEKTDGRCIGRGVGALPPSLRPHSGSAGLSRVKQKY